MKRIYLIDCPGIVPPSKTDTEEDILLRGVVRVENVEHPAQYIEAVLRRTQVKHIERTYELKHSEYNDDPVEFLSILARKSGRLLKGGEADVDGVAKMVLNDFLRGKIPWFTPVPKQIGESVEEAMDEVVQGREGRLGEMPGKRKADVLNEMASTVRQDGIAVNTDDEKEDENEFAAFSDDESEEVDSLAEAQINVEDSEDDDDDDDDEDDNESKSNDLASAKEHEDKVPTLIDTTAVNTIGGTNRGEEEEEEGGVKAVTSS